MPHASASEVGEARSYRSVEPDRIDDLLEPGGQVGREDARLVEGVQSSIRAGLAELGRLMGPSEPLIAHFQHLIEAALPDAAAG